MKLTVFFDDQLQLWVGVVQSDDGNRLRAGRHLFGKGPKEADIMDFIHNDMQRLLDRTTQSVEVKPREERRINPKRLLRIAAKELRQRGVSTYAQQVMSLEYEHRKLQRKSDSKRRMEEKKERTYQLKVQKAKQKHRGK